MSTSKQLINFSKINCFSHEVATLRDYMYAWPTSDWPITLAFEISLVLVVCLRV